MWGLLNGVYPLVSFHFKIEILGMVKA